MYLSVALALVAACSNAASNVIQRVANKDESGVRTLSLRLVWDLLHRPLWFAGIAAVTLSFVLQATALKFGPLALVEPLLVWELPLTFVGAVAVFRARLGRREWTAAVVMSLGLAALVFFAHPAGGRHVASWPAWVAGLGSSELVVAALVAAGRRAGGDARAALYGAGTGVQFGTTAALMNGAVAHVTSGVGAVLASWQTYAMVGAGIAGMFLLQNAMQSGKLVAAQPGITLLDPSVAIAWGVGAFGEHLSGDPLHLALAGAGGLLMVAGAVLLARSPLLDTAHEGDARRPGRRPEAPVPA